MPLQPIHTCTHDAYIRSGFEGPWTFSPVTFSNEYFKLLYNETYVLPTIVSP